MTELMIIATFILPPVLRLHDLIVDVTGFSALNRFLWVGFLALTVVVVQGGV